MARLRNSVVRVHRLFRLILFSSIVLLSNFSARPVRAATVLPPGFSESVWASGISNPIALVFSPDGRLFVAQQDGRLRVIKNGVLNATPFVTLPVDPRGERGLLGIAFHPSYPSQPYIYLYYTTSTSPIHNRVSRFQFDPNNPDIALGGSETVILELENLSTAQNHNGGALEFGLDGKLYVAVGENANANNSQTLDNRLGKILRINPDGSIPTDNPFYNTATGVNRSIWALGLRNPFTFDIQPGTGRMHINDVGGGAWEEINLGRAGANYGWPITEGPTTNPAFDSPIYAYEHGGTPFQCAIVGAAFYNPPVSTFPSQYAGDYFFGDYCAAWIKVYDIATGAVSDFASGTHSYIADVEVGPDGALYYAARGDGTINRIQYGTSTPPVITAHPANTTVVAGQSATFTVSASGTPPLSYQWQKNGSNIPGATNASYTTPPTTLSDSGSTYRAVVTNAFGSATSNAATLTVVENQPPVGTITQPAAGSKYNAGDVLNFAGTGTDAEDGTLPASAFSWQLDFHHDDHIHPALTLNGVMSGSYTIPREGHTDTNVFYRITLTVRDSVGLTHTTTRDVMPNLSQITLQTNPNAGLTLALDGQPQSTPLTVQSVVGVTRSLGAPSPQIIGTTKYVFLSWSDGGAATHNINTPATPTTYTATYTAIPTPTLISPSGMFNTSLTPEYRWNMVSGATSYALSVYDLASGAPIHYQVYPSSVCTFSVCSVTPSVPLTTNRYYVWYAAAFNRDWGLWSEGMIFLASIPPGAPTILSPTGFFVPNPETLQPQYSWTHTTGSILYYLVVYNLQTGSLQFAQVFDTLANPSLCQSGVCRATPNVPGSTLTNGMTYGVYVAGLSYGGAGPWSPGTVFIIYVRPAPPTLTAPTGAQPNRPFYRWNKVQGATDYYIQVMNTSGTTVFGQWVSSAATCDSTTCEFQQPSPLAVGNYSVFMASGNPAGISNWGNGLAFNVTASPPQAEPPTATPAPAPTFRP